MDQVSRLVQEGNSVAGACEELGIHRSQYYRWKKQQEQSQGGIEGLEPKSRAPHTTRRTSMALRDEMIQMACSGRYKSANQITQALRHKGNRTAPGTVIRNLEKAGLYDTIEVLDGNGDVIRRKRGLSVGKCYNK